MSELMIEITEHVFRLGRRLLGFLFTLAREHLEPSIKRLEDHYRDRMPKASDDDVVGEVSRHLFNLYTFAAFAIVKHVSLSVNDRNLQEVFRRLVTADPNLANRLYKLAIDLESAGAQPPKKTIEELNGELSRRPKPKVKGEAGIYNNVAHTVLRALVVDYLYLNNVPRPKVQELCQELKIELRATASDQGRKRLPPSRS